MEGKTKTADEILNSKSRGLFKFEILEAMEIYANQEREKAVSEFKKQLYSDIVDSQLKTVGDYEKLFRTQSELLIEKLK